MTADEPTPGDGVAYRVFVTYGWAVVTFWVTLGVLSATLLVVNLRDDGWDSGAVSNLLLTVSSCMGVIHARVVARHIRRP